MSNSRLVKYTKLSPNHSGRRNHEIDTITIHCIVGQITMESLGNIFTPRAKRASSNYGVCIDGISLHVDEANRSWCSSSSVNDNRAITIEVACDLFHPYTVRPSVMESLIELLVDIVKRNKGFGGKLVWRNDRNNPGNMTIHRWFANTACPGEYLMSKMGWIADEVNRRLNNETEKPKQLYRVRKTWDNALSQLGAYTKLQNAINMAKKHPGYNIYNIYGEKVEYIEDEKTVTELALEVINGMWGNGQDRVKRLTSAGYDYQAVQRKVNELI